MNTLLDMIRDTPINRRGLALSPIVLLIGFIGRTAHWPISWLWLPLSGLLALGLQFGPEKIRFFLKKMKKGSWKTILLVIVLLFLIATIMGTIQTNIFGIQSVGDSAANDAFSPNLATRLIFLATAWVSISGEEFVMAAIAFPLYHFLVKRYTGNKAFLIASLISAFIFGSMHLHAYNGNLFQCYGIIGLLRLPLNYAWKKTESLQGGIWTHIIYDYIQFLL